MSQDLSLYLLTDLRTQRESWKSLNHHVDKICHLATFAAYFIVTLTR